MYNMKASGVPKKFPKCSTITGQGGITAPATICATPVEGPIDIEEGLPTDIPLVYYYGHTTPETNPDLYRYLVERLASLMDRRTQQNAKVPPTPSSNPGLATLRERILACGGRTTFPLACTSLKANDANLVRHPR
jgi:hypothetical protein